MLCQSHLAVSVSTVERYSNRVRGNRFARSQKSWTYLDGEAHAVGSCAFEFTEPAAPGPRSYCRALHRGAVAAEQLRYLIV